MKHIEKYHPVLLNLGALVMIFLAGSCESDTMDENPGDNPGDKKEQLTGFPDFITAVEDYFFLSIGGTPELDTVSYRLKITGAVHTPVYYSLEQLRNLEMAERTLTIECQGNGPNGKLAGTATWRGFRLYDLLEDTGIKEGTTIVKYLSADGYFTYNTLEELQQNDVLGALYMNGEPLTVKYGSPLRIIFPGYYGVRQPGWVVEMELLDSGPQDYYSRSGWHTDSLMSVDSKILFPENHFKATPGDTVEIGGTAFGGKRIASVDITVDDGHTWIPATIVKSMDLDYVWVFWKAVYVPGATGEIQIQSRATGEDGRIQPHSDSNYLDGTSSWPSVRITVE